MSHLNIHYIPSTGMITCWDNGWRKEGDTSSHIEGSIVLTKFFSGAAPHLDMKTKKIDVTTGEVVDKTMAEIALGELPTLHEMKAAVHYELINTDKYVLPDRDDLSPKASLLWRQYRKTLRDLSKGNPPPTIYQMISAWPLDPNGNDVIVRWRSKI